ncbi:low temperature requirement protein A [Paenibacillus harenae]|uniref:Low temperature requirement protein LtrA n=1 Tax=Paenibacillus harenae TaxID=306543 RepID=A0ABT9U222_PAEHA|nr:low temperature requirement protein A [Paenibacillus harenae]MDQ0063060.1 low temperature requirement protein LtrA [Paenibacillus harenae]MDQ0113677.1 low temperature requirement protein LtrA [Paenibacillus harenae]
MHQLRRGDSEKADMEAKVSYLELFFDLVFVFTITQVAHLVIDAHSLLDVFKAILVLTVIWWMYGGYAWLANNIGTDRFIYRMLMFCGMAGFLIMAISIPSIFRAGGAPFGIAFLLVTIIHILLFKHSPHVTSIKAITHLAPFNFSAALLVLASGILNTWYTWSWWLMVAAVLVILNASFKNQGDNFVINTRHFVERHSLIVLIALGETILSIGLGSSHFIIKFTLFVSIILSLAIVITLWWSYFHMDTILAEDYMLQASLEKRARLAMLAYWHTHLIMISGIVISASGIEVAIKHLNDESVHSFSWYLNGGIALYLVGSAIFRRLVHIGPVGTRLGAAALSLFILLFNAFSWMGTLLMMTIQILVLAGMIVIEQHKYKKFSN